MSKKYVVFLDIDGVFTSQRAHSSTVNKNNEMWTTFDPIAVEFFNRLSDKYDIDFVFMTSWVNTLEVKNSLHRHWVVSTFRNSGFNGKFPEAWKVNPENRVETYTDNRAVWVKEYLEIYNHYEDFILVDDCDYNFDKILGVKRHVKTDPENGVLWKHMQKLLSLTGNWDEKLISKK